MTFATRICGFFLLHTLALIATEPTLYSVDNLKGVYLEGTRTNRTGVEFAILLHQGRQWKAVPSTRPFQDGDRLRLRLRLNQKGYVYVLHRTLSATGNGADAGTRDLTHETEYNLLFPTNGNGPENHIEPSVPMTVPKGKLTLRMDSVPGVERLYVIVSRKPLPVAGRTGGPQVASSRERLTGAAPSPEFRALMAEFARNTQVALPKGIEVEGYGVAVAPDRPLMAELQLVHKPRVRP